jgi:hypothetical protein
MRLLLRLTRPAISLAIAVTGAGCIAQAVTRTDVQSFNARPQRMTREQIINQLTGVLVDRGFDIKQTNKDAGLVTTEYKKFASEGSTPPFDYYLQIRATVTGTDAAPMLKLTPMVREQNRMNAAAFTEHELSYYVGSPSAVQLISSMRPSGWKSQGQTAFMNVVSDLAPRLGMSVDQFEQVVTKTPANTLTAKE